MQPTDLLGVLQALASLPRSEDGAAAALSERLQELGYERAMATDDEEEADPEETNPEGAGPAGAALNEEERREACQAILEFLEEIGWIHWDSPGKEYPYLDASVRQVSDGPSLSKALRHSLLRHETAGPALLGTCELAWRLGAIQETESTGLLLTEFAQLTLQPPGEIPQVFHTIQEQRTEACRQGQRALEEAPDQEELAEEDQQDALRAAMSIQAYNRMADTLGDEETADRIHPASHTLRYFIATGLLAYGNLSREVQTAEITPRGESLLVEPQK